MHYALAAAPASQPAQQTLEQTAHELERRMSRAAKAVGYNVAFRRALPRAAAQLLDSAVGPAANESAMRFARVCRALSQGKAVLQPYAVAPSSDVQWGVAMNPGESLGWWPVALQVLKFAGQAALAYAGYVLVDGYNTTQKVEADAELVRANTEKVVAGAATKLQETDPKAAGDMMALILKARATAEEESSGWGWLDTAGRAALGIGTGALLAVAAFYLLGSRSRTGRKRNPSPSPSASTLLALAGMFGATPPPPANTVKPGGMWEGSPMYIKTGDDAYAKGVLAAGALYLLSKRRKPNPRRRRSRR